MHVVDQLSSERPAGPAGDPAKINQNCIRDQMHNDHCMPISAYRACSQFVNVDNNVILNHNRVDVIANSQSSDIDGA